MTDPAASAGAADSAGTAGEMDGPATTIADGVETTPAVKRKSWQHQLISWAIVLIVAAGASIILRSFVVQTFEVPSISMYPTLQEGDRILVQKCCYSLHRGDIVVFTHPPRDLEPPLNEDLVKRIIGLPGEVIWSKGNTVYINGKPLSEPYLPKGTQMSESITKQKIPPGHYFVMGDNRSDSYDSRAWGTITQSMIVGRVFLVIWRGGHPVWISPPG
jgi:signal peptidase I